MIHPEPHPLAGQRVMLISPHMSGHHGKWCEVVDWYSRITNCAGWLKQEHGMDNKVRQLTMRPKEWRMMYPDDHNFILGRVGYNKMEFIVHHSALGPIAPTWKEIKDSPNEPLAESNIWLREDDYSLRLFKGSNDPHHDHFWSMFWHLRTPGGDVLSKSIEWMRSNPQVPLEPTDTKLFLYQLKHGKLPTPQPSQETTMREEVAKQEPIVRKAPPVPARKKKKPSGPVQQDLFSTGTQ